MGAAKRGGVSAAYTPAPMKSAMLADAPAKAATATSGGQRSCLTSQLRKTKICVYHLKGACQYGTDCAFAHSCTELQSTPDLRKTRLCQAFDNGNCDNPDCSFAHGEEELRSTNLFFKKTLCIWNQKGKCRNGEQCRFAHGTAELRIQPGSASGGQSSGKASSDGTGSNASEKGSGSRRGARQAARVAASSTTSSNSSGRNKLNSEPMKVRPTKPLLDPAVLEPMQVPTPNYLSEGFKSVSGDMPGMPYVPEPSLAGLEAPLAPGMPLYPEAQWWPWQGGMATGAMMAGCEEDMKAHMEADLDRLRENVTNLTRQCSEIQWQIMTAQPGTSSQLTEEVLQQLQYATSAMEPSVLKASSMGGMDAMGMGQGVEDWSTYWGA